MRLMRANGKEKERNGGKQGGEQLPTPPPPPPPPRRLIESADTRTENKTCQRVGDDCMTPPPVSVALECIARLEMVVSRVPTRFLLSIIRLSRVDKRSRSISHVYELFLIHYFIFLFYLQDIPFYN